MTRAARTSHDRPLADQSVDAYPPHQERRFQRIRLIDCVGAPGREVPVLGHVFESKGSGWAGHLEALKALWSSAIYRSGRWHEPPLGVHQRIVEIPPEHRARRLQPGEPAVGQAVPADVRTLLIAMARRMARTMAPMLPGQSR